MESVLPVETPKRRSVRYSLTRGDIFRWQYYLLVRNRVLLVFVLISTSITLWINLRSAEMAGQPVGFKIFYSVLLICFMLAFVFLLTLAMMGCMAMFKKYRGFLGEHELEIRDEGLVERTDVNESLHRWAGFHKIVRTGRYLYIYVTDHNIHIVPRRFFGSEQEEGDFREEIERRMKAV